MVFGDSVFRNNTTTSRRSSRSSRLDEAKAQSNIHREANVSAPVLKSTRHYFWTGFRLKTPVLYKGMSRKILHSRPEVGKISLTSSPTHHRRRSSGAVPLGSGLRCFHLSSCIFI